jgi:hypothetical protein
MARLTPPWLDPAIVGFYVDIFGNTKIRQKARLDPLAGMTPSQAKIRQKARLDPMIEGKRQDLTP